MKKRKWLPCLIMICLLSFFAGSTAVTVSAATPEASIGSRNYATVQKAVNAVKKGQTIKLKRNIKYAYVKNSRNVSFTLDLNKHTIAGSEVFIMSVNKIENGCLVFSNGTVKIKNGTVNGGIYAAGRSNLTLTGVNVKKTIAVTSNARVTLDRSSCGRSVESVRSTTKIFLKNSTIGQIKNAGWASVSNVTFPDSVVGGAVENSGKIALKNCKVKGEIPGDLRNSGTMSVAGGSYGCVVNEKGSLTIAGGTFKTVSQYQGNLIDVCKGSTARITAGAFTQSNKSWGYGVCVNGKLSVSGGTFRSYNNAPTFSVNDSGVLNFSKGTVRAYGANAVTVLSGRANLTGGTFYTKASEAILCSVGGICKKSNIREINSRSNISWQ